MTGPLVTVSRALMFGLTNVAQRNILPNGAVAAMERVQKMVDRHKDQAARRDYMRRFMWAKRHAGDDEKETPKDTETEVKSLANTEEKKK